MGTVSVEKCSKRLRVGRGGMMSEKPKDLAIAVHMNHQGRPLSTCECLL